MEKVLIVDDNGVNRKMLHKILEDYYETIEVSSGEEALEVLSDEREDFLAVLLDIVMPGMDGFEVLKHIRNNPRLSEIPVIIQTENTDEPFEMGALKSGATDFVSKPYKPDIIRTRLENIINTRIMLSEITNLSSDELTGLMSVNKFYFEGAKWIKENPETNFDVVALDIVHFGVINDSEGVDGGNAILKSIADRIKELQKEVMFFASRVYADRFVMLIRRKEGYLDRIMEEADKITEQYKSHMNVHFKFGVYEIVEEDVRLSNVCGRAFSATNLIKDYYGNRYAYYDEKLHNQIVYEERINDEMETALIQRQFEVYYQPKYELLSQTLAGAEALVRWNHPVDGMIAPGNFIPIFEKNGFIVKLDQYVWNIAASKIAQWYEEGEKIVPISVNISRIDIDTIDVVSVISDIVKRYDIAPELLHLEITESAYMEDTNKIIRVVRELEEKGFIIEMDDFGSGYSSLNMLAKLPINILKLDMNFIQAIEDSTSAKTIIEYTIGLAKWMNLPVVAEGVETDEQLELLRKLECNYVQGYVFAKPMPEKEFEKLLKPEQELGENSAEEEQGLYIYNSTKKYCMMIVEDLHLNRSIIRSYFEDYFSIVEAENGKIAMDYLNRGARVDVILLDIFMPEMNGYEFLEQIKKNSKLKKFLCLWFLQREMPERKRLPVERMPLPPNPLHRSLSLTVFVFSCGQTVCLEK